jgi:hypothetical protein
MRAAPFSFLEDGVEGKVNCPTQAKGWLEWATRGIIASRGIIATRGIIASRHWFSRRMTTAIPA